MDLYEAFKADPEAFPQFSLRDTLFLHYSCPQIDRVIQVYAKHIQFSFTLSGKRHWHHGDKTWTSTPGSGLIVKKSGFIQELPSDVTDWNVMVFYLKDDYLRHLLEEFQEYLPVQQLPDPGYDMIDNFVIDDRIRACYESFLPYFRSEHPLPESILEGKFKELLFQILSHEGNRHILAYVLKIQNGYQTPVWEVMEANFTYNLKLADFANIANRSLSTFTREFKAHYKMPPGKWLNERRLAKAKFLLETTELTIQEIAFDCGFNSPSHFSKMFRESFGQRPSSVKKRLTA